MTILYLVFWGTARLLSKAATPFYFLTNSVWRFWFLHLLANTCWYLTFQFRHPAGIKCLGHFLSQGHLVSPLPHYSLWPKSQMASLSTHPAVPFGPIWADLSAFGTDHPSGSSWQNSWVSSSRKTSLNSTHHWKSIHQMSNSPAFPKLQVCPRHSPSHFICGETNFQSIVGSSLCIFLFFFFFLTLPPPPPSCFSSSFSSYSGSSSSSSFSFSLSFSCCFVFHNSRGGERDRR